MYPWCEGWVDDIGVTSFPVSGLILLLDQSSWVMVISVVAVRLV